MTLTAERLRELLAYNPNDGVFIWRVAPNGRVNEGNVAGSLSADGYNRVQVDGRRYGAHRLAWLYTHGRFPPGHLDHIDGDKTNNRIANLRGATHGENMQNQQRSHKGGTSAYLGVYWRKDRNKWCAAIRVNKRLTHIGYFVSEEAAAAAYVAAKRKMHTFGML